MQAVVYPFKNFGGTRVAWQSVRLCWALAAILASPQLLIFAQTEQQSSPSATNVTTHRYECESCGYSSEWQRKVYFSFLTLYMYIIPLCIMCFCYTKIIRALWLRAEGPQAIDFPLVHFVTTRRTNASDSAADGSRIQQQGPAERGNN